MRARFVLLGALLFLAACGDAEPPAAPASRVADLGSDPQPQETNDGAARYTPPQGRWRVRTETLAPGEWYEEYAEPEGQALLRVNVFPIRANRDPAVVLGLALDTFLRGIGTDGFGSHGARVLAVSGAPAAQATWTAVVALKTVAGEARLLRASNEQWAFAVGYAPVDGDRGLAPVIRGFVSSLEPAAPVFYERRFFAPEDLKLVVAAAKDEPPVTMRDLMAVELVLEAGAGMRFPLSTGAADRAALREDASAKEAGTRASYRETGAALEKAAGLAADERLAGMRALGQRALQGIGVRAKAGYAPAQKLQAVWRRLSDTALGTPEDGLTVGALQALHEEAAFLASLATNREVRAEPERANRIGAALTARWAELPAEEKDALRAAGLAWARLRKAWDESSPTARNDVRRRVASALAPTPQQEVEALADERALMRWMDAVPAAALDGYVLRAAALASDRRAGLLQALEAASPTGWDLGW